MTEGATGAVAERTGIYEHVREIKYYMAAFIFVDRGHDLFKNFGKNTENWASNVLNFYAENMWKSGKNGLFLAIFGHFLCPI